MAGAFANICLKFTSLYVFTYHWCRFPEVEFFKEKDVRYVKKCPFGACCIYRLLQRHDDLHIVLPCKRTP